MSSMWSFIGNGSGAGCSVEPSGFQTLISRLSASLSPSGTDISGMFGTWSINAFHSSINGRSFSSSAWIVTLSVCMAAICDSRAAASVICAIAAETLFCSAFLASSDVIISRRWSSTATRRSRSTLIFFLVAAIFTMSRFSRINLISSIQ